MSGLKTWPDKDFKHETAGFYSSIRSEALYKEAPGKASLKLLAEQDSNKGRIGIERHPASPRQHRHSGRKQWSDYSPVCCRRRVKGSPPAEELRASPPPHLLRVVAVLLPAPTAAPSPFGWYLKLPPQLPLLFLSLPTAKGAWPSVVLSPEPAMPGVGTCSLVA